MHEKTPCPSLPPNTQFEWKEFDGARVIKSILIDDGVAGGKLSVKNGLLPPSPESAVLMAVSGMAACCIARVLDVNVSNVADYKRMAFDALEVPTEGEKRRLPAIVAHLCLPGGMLRIIRPISFCIEPDELSLTAAALIGQGKEWDYAAEACQLSPIGLRSRILKWYKLRGGVEVASLLLHLYASSFLNPMTIVEAQEKARARTIEAIKADQEEMMSAESWAFEPFPEDPSKRIYILAGSTLDKSQVESVETSYGVFAVLTANTARTSTEQAISLSVQEKLALIVLALGGTNEDAEMHCTPAKLYSKLGIDEQDTRSPDRATAWACKHLLTPHLPSLISPSSRAVQVARLLHRREYLSLGEGDALRNYATEIAREHGFGSARELMTFVHAAGLLFAEKL